MHCQRRTMHSFTKAINYLSWMFVYVLCFQFVQLKFKELNNNQIEKEIAHFANHFLYGIFPNLSHFVDILFNHIFLFTAVFISSIISLMFILQIHPSFLFSPKLILSSQHSCPLSHYTLIATSRTFAYAAALAYWECPPSSHLLSLSYSLFGALRLKFHLPFEIFFNSSSSLLIL